MRSDKGLGILDNVATVTQEEMMKLVSLFRKNGFRGEYDTIEHSEAGGDEYNVIMVFYKFSSRQELIWQHYFFNKFMVSGTNG